jgi:hypothetical protein
MPLRLALLVFLLASAPRASESPRSLVEEKLLAPLAAREEARSSYSRARPPAAERRVRMLDTEPIADAKGGAFVRFAVDARYGRAAGRWQQNVITGCVYAATGEVYLRYGHGFRAAGVLLGKKVPPAASHVCRAAGAQAVVAGD